MGDAFLRALASDLEQTQRVLRSNCLFCVPQPRSLVADEAISQETLYTHFLTPVGFGDDDAGVTTGDLALGGGYNAQESRPGEYDTLNGKQVSIAGSHIHTGKGFDDRRKVRILLSEKREIHHQEITVLHISRPLVGGLALPEDPSELDVATLRKYTAILRSFPENELCFYQLDETVNQVHKICQQNQFFNRYEQTLPAILREEWEAAVDELIHAGSFDDVEEDRQRHQRHGGGVDHLLQIQQVVECYLMEQLHDWVFPRVVTICEEQDRKLRQVMYRMRHYSPEDFGIRKEFQCFALEARDVLLGVTAKKTPLDMLLVFKACINRISEAITRNIKLRRLDFDLYQLTTDDILDQLLFVLVQVFNHVAMRVESGSGQEMQASTTDDESSTSTSTSFPIAAVLKYISDYHFINSNTTELGFTIANFQVAIEYFLMRGAHNTDCKECADLILQGETRSQCTQVIRESKCVQAAHAIRRDLMKAVENLELAPRGSDSLAGQEAAPRANDLADSAGENEEAAMRRLSIVGEWYASDEAIAEDKEAVDSSPSSLEVHPVEFMVDGKPSCLSGSKLTQVSGGQRFFAVVNEDGELFTWGDSSGG